MHNHTKARIAPMISGTEMRCLSFYFIALDSSKVDII